MLQCYSYGYFLLFNQKVTQANFFIQKSLKSYPPKVERKAAVLLEGKLFYFEYLRPCMFLKFH